MQESWTPSLIRSSTQGALTSRTPEEQELLVIHETIESRNDDDATDLFNCQSITGLPEHSETQVPT